MLELAPYLHNKYKDTIEFSTRDEIQALAEDGIFISNEVEGMRKRQKSYGALH